MDEFMDDLEEDKDLRQLINIYKNPNAGVESAVENNDDDNNGPRISLEEMMEDLVIYDDDVMEVYE